MLATFTIQLAACSIPRCKSKYILASGINDARRDGFALGYSISYALFCAWARVASRSGAECVFWGRSHTTAAILPRKFCFCFVFLETLYGQITLPQTKGLLHRQFFELILEKPRTYVLSVHFQLVASPKFFAGSVWHLQRTGLPC